MKKLIAIIMVIAMVASFIPATFAQGSVDEVKKVDKSQFNTLDHINNYGIDNNGNKQTLGGVAATTTSADFSEVDKSMLSINKDTFKTKAAWYESTHYGLPLFDEGEALELNYGCDYTDFTESTDFLSSHAAVEGMFVSPSNNMGYIDDVGFKPFKKGEGFFFTFDLLQSYTSAPVYFDDDAEVDIYMYQGSQSDWESDSGLPLSGIWQGMTRVTTQVIAPNNGTIYMFFIVMRKADLQNIGGTKFSAMIHMSDYTKAYQQAKVQGTVEPIIDKQYSADLGPAATSEKLLVYGDDIGNITTYGALYKVDLKGGDKYALRVDSGNIGIRLFFLDENKDMMANTFLGSGAVGQISYDEAILPILPVIDGTYYVLISTFYAGESGDVSFSFVDFYDTTLGKECKNYMHEEIDLDQFGTEDVTGTDAEGNAAWAYWWYADFGMGALVLAYPGEYHVTGEKKDVYVEIYDDVHVTFDNAHVGSVWAESIWGPAHIESKGNSSCTDNYFGQALLNDTGYMGPLYITGESFEVAGEMSTGSLLEVPTHILTKTFKASATTVAGTYPVALWVSAFNTPHLTWGEGVTFKSATGSALKECRMYFDSSSAYLNGYTVSEYAAVIRYSGDPNYQYIASEFTATSKGTSDPVDPIDDGLLGDANCDGVVNTGDAVAILKALAGTATLTAQGQKNADFNKDGVVNTGDATAILKKLAGI